MGEGLLYDTDINEMKDKKYYIVCHVDLYILLPTLNKIVLLTYIDIRSECPSQHMQHVVGYCDDMSLSSNE
jgi:hypothetical protein